MKLLLGVYRVLLVLFAGSLWSVGLFAAPTLFNLQPDRHLAGILAGRLFAIEAYLGLIVLLMALLLPDRRGRFGVFLAAPLLLVNEWLLRPAMSAALGGGPFLGLSFIAWHGVSAFLYLIASLSLLYLVWNENFR